MLNLFFKAILPLVSIIMFTALNGCGKDDHLKELGAVEGIVKDERSGEILNGAQIILGRGYSKVADASGNFRFDRLIPDTYVLQYSMNGYITESFSIDVLKGETTMCEIEMVKGSDVISVSSTIFDFGSTSSVQTLTVRNNSAIAQSVEVEIGKATLVPWLDIPLNAFYMNSGESKVIELKADRTKLNQNETGLIAVKDQDKTIYIVVKIIK